MMAFIQALGSTQSVAPVDPPPTEKVIQFSSGHVGMSGAHVAGITTLQSYRLWSPTCIYHNGKTFVTYPSEREALPYGQARMTLFDKNGGFDRFYNVGRINSGPEIHQIPVMVVDADGKLRVIQENVHNAPIDIYTGQANGEYGFFEKAAASIGSTLAYPHPFMFDNGDFVLWSRGTTAWDIYTTFAGDGFESWGTPRKTSEAGTDPLLRHYPFVPFGHGYKSINGKFYVGIGRRIDDGILGGMVRWFRFYLLVTEDFDTFENYGGTFSHNITADGDLTETILQTNFETYSHASSAQGFNPTFGISPDGKVYQIVGNATQDGYLFVYWNGSAWATRVISIPNIAPIANYNVNQQNPFNYIIPFSQTDIRVVVDCLIGGIVRQRWFHTADEGVTWTDKGFLFPEVDDIRCSALLPVNIHEIQNNENFGVWGTAIDGDYNKFYGKAAAFGSLQVMPGRSITPAVTMSRATGNLFDYEPIDANLSRTGNNVSSITDNFGIRNATGVNNPQWNGSNAITLNGTNNYFNLGDVAGLATVREGTYFGVVNVPFETAVIMLSFTDNTGLETFEIGLSTATIGYNVSTFNRGTTSTNTRVYGQERIDDGEDHLVVIVVDGRSKADIYIDGRLQYFEHTATDATTWSYIGDSQWNYTTVNAARIGSRDSTSDAFTPLTFKRLTGYSECLPTAELHEKMLYLCNLYSITYQNQFQIP